MVHMWLYPNALYLVHASGFRPLCMQVQTELCILHDGNAAIKATHSFKVFSPHSHGLVAKQQSESMEVG